MNGSLSTNNATDTNNNRDSSRASGLGHTAYEEVLPELGVHEPVYGAPTGAMKPLARRIKGNQVLAET
jgi:hypothetical protein